MNDKETQQFNKFIRKQFGGEDQVAEEQPVEQPGEEQVVEEPVTEVKSTRKTVLPFIKNDDVSKMSDTIYSQGNNNCNGKSGTFTPESEYLLSASDKPGEPGAPDLSKLFADYRAKVEIVNRRFVAPQAAAMKTLLHHKLPIHKTELNMIVDQSALEHVIETDASEKEQGNKIIAWLKSQFQTPKYQHIITGLSLFVNNGYVHIVRDGLGYEPVGPTQIRSGSDVITEELVGGPLEYFPWQIGKPIDYTLIRDHLFKNAFQKQIEPNMGVLKEAEKILSQEYLISIQPEPDFLMWAVKRLIECWYACPDLQNNIRKIKILVNLFRARGKEPYNMTNGVLPMLVVYPRYGIKSTEIVIKNLLYHFFAQLNVGWECSQPTYFIKINSLFHYTNATLDLKLYYRNVIAASKDSLQPESFTDTYTNFKDASRFEDINSQINDDLPKKTNKIEVTKIQPIPVTRV